MSTNHTTNYALCQWLATDQVKRTDFNEDNAKIDAALATIPKIAAGTYTGNGAASRIIPLGFTPKLVFLCTQWGETSYYSPGAYFGYGGLALADHPARLSYSAGGEVTETDMITIVSSGFQVVCVQARGSNAYSNYNKEVYHYIAIG